MDVLILIVLFAAIVVPVVGGILWFVFFVWLARTALGQAERDLNRTLPNLLNALGQIPQGGFQNLNQSQQAQLMRLLTQAGNQFGQLDDLARQRHDLQVSELMGVAANAGIDWHP